MIRLGASHPEWAVGFADAVWWSRRARPSLHAWAAAGRPRRWMAWSVENADPDPKAVACDGLLLRGGAEAGAADAMGLRIGEGRPVSAITTPLLAWC